MRLFLLLQQSKAHNFNRAPYIHEKEKTMRLMIIFLLLATSLATAGNLPRTVITSEGTYIVVPNSITGETLAIIKTSKGKHSK